MHDDRLYVYLYATGTTAAVTGASHTNAGSGDPDGDTPTAVPWDGVSDADSCAGMVEDVDIEARKVLDAVTDALPPAETLDSPLSW